MHRNIVLGLTAFLTCTGAANAQTPSKLTDPAGILRGLKGLDVMVKMTSDKLDSASVHTIVAARLTENGFTVGPKNSPFLAVSCTALDRGDRLLVAFSCDMRLHQFATVIPSNTLMMANTWSTSNGVALVGLDRSRELMLSAVDGMTDEFIVAWKAANAKKK